MSGTFAAMTELEAVNTMLSVIGEAPVNTLEDSGLIDVAVARQILNDTSREVQSRGWKWNIDRNVTLPLTTEGEVLIPLDALSADPELTYIQATVRGQRLWNAADLSFTWTECPTLAIKRFLPFSDMPQAARHYITVRAGRIFADRVITSEKTAGFNQRDEMMALVTLQNDEAETGDYSMKDAGPAATIGIRFATRGFR